MGCFFAARLGKNTVLLEMLEGWRRKCLSAGRRADGEDTGCLSPGPGVAPTPLDAEDFGKTWRLK